jgi:hypothetical protein
MEMFMSSSLFAESKKEYVRDRDGGKLCPESGRSNCSFETKEKDSSSNASSHSFPPDGLESKSSNGPHASESKDPIVDSASPHLLT